MSTESSLTTLKNMLEFPLPEWKEKNLISNNADNHQYVDTCWCLCCMRIKTLKTLAGPMPFAVNTPVWILNYYGNGWEQATFIGRDKPDFCEGKIKYTIRTSAGYSTRVVSQIRFECPMVGV